MSQAQELELKEPLTVVLQVQASPLWMRPPTNTSWAQAVAPPIQAPMISAAMSETAIQVKIHSQPGRSYQVQTTSSLGASAVWGNEGNVLTGTGEILTFSDSILPTASKFYRVIVQ